MSYHSHLNVEFYVKHPNIYGFVDILQKIRQTAYVSMNSMPQQAHGSLNTSERRQSLWCLLRLSYTAYYRKGVFWRKCAIVMDREPSCDNALDFIPFGLFSCVFIQFFHAFLYTFVVRFIHY